jgi:lactate dehydrogenase-like 2-hydroxyacid dehydrogenase
MSQPLFTALQLSPFSPELEAALAERFRVIRWFESDVAAQARWLERERNSVRAVVTGGQIGCSNALMEALPQLGIIAINGVGVDKVDLEFAQARGVRVTTTPGTLTEDVADLAVALMLALLRDIPGSDAYVRAGHWQRGPRALARKVSGRRFGIVGMGQIGAAIAARLAPFGTVSYYGPHRKDAPYHFEPDLLQLARDCSVLVLSCPATPATRHLINGPVLEALGPEGYLVNVARGAVVDEPALCKALSSGGIAGAALDVFADEPRVPLELLQSSRAVLTPHVASSTVETRRAMAELVLANLDAFCGTLPRADSDRS